MPRGSGGYEVEDSLLDIRGRWCSVLADLGLAKRLVVLGLLANREVSRCGMMLLSGLSAVQTTKTRRSSIRWTALRCRKRSLLAN